RSVGEAEGDAIRAKGLAEAEVVQATGFAEAEAMLKKAQAWQQYNEAAILQQLIEALPQVASAIAEPLSKMDRMVVISSGGEGGAGSSKVTRDVVDIVAQVPATLEAVTGVDLMAMLKNLPGVTGKKPSEPEA
ncbi:MAG: flotillin family protein, partial [Chloroflexi bacterium]|nr:flotillin family protein [Chloroflexota bacterium]